MKKKLLFLLVFCLLITGCNEKVKENEELIDKEPIKEEKKLSIIDIDSNTRPYAVVINNYPSAVKVQSGLDKAYIVYEFPIEGGMTRSLALYKDISDVKIGTIRSARHNYIDYVMENDAIFVHFGGSATAYEQIGKTDHIDGNTTDSAPFYREQHENLAYEHRVYTDLSKVIDYVNNTKKLRTTTSVKPPLNYVVDEIDLSSNKDAMKANKLDIYYSNSYYITFKYNEETKRYDRLFKDTNHVDYFTKKQFDCKNVIVTFIDWGTVSNHSDAAGNSYLDLYNTGSGDGYYMTNGYIIPIKWEKETRDSKTIYKNLDGSILDVNDGNTWIMLASKSKKFNIE